MKYLIISLVFVATACGAGYQNQSSTSSYTYDDGVTPKKQVTISHRGHGDAASIGFPPLMGGLGGYGGGLIGMYGQPTMGGSMCTIHPDYCGERISVALSTNPDLERRVSGNEKRVKALGGAYRVMIDEGRKTNARVTELEKKQTILIKWGQRSYFLDSVQCKAIRSNPEAITDTDLKPKVDKACNELLGADATEAGGKQ